jgi:1-acyl-sn-glycerol-3-phosphate acyltransferase
MALFGVVTLHRHEYPVFRALFMRSPVTLRVVISGSGPFRPHLFVISNHSARLDIPVIMEPHHHSLYPLIF